MICIFIFIFFKKEVDIVKVQNDFLKKLESQIKFGIFKLIKRTEHTINISIEQKK